ncbi:MULTISPECIES: lytic murein transglycosylase [unclassified Bosea (in: a-proteobacteria)]|uniref:lytic murein transglycosylase n=1 Tax=unclassified Bosea (in: a-proteobacteria) TaxID=2653178 RepID=UPI000F74D089|nr:MULTISPECIES: lytic murein transglycosylase [unclassified Bosea (in: a-proteobacteria)]AZO80019.1 lytic transglycosylase [Bosea sp. Tri-49]RXT22800.1 lytic transglycosylase [Bosea sp. Tri-39]RXT38269.1 lytic transglycosylase [Bosea sp. Tri-54]
MRPVTVLAFAVALGLGPALAQTTGSINPARAQTPKPEARPAAPGFDGFLRTLWPMAQARGISRQTFDLAFQGVTPDPSIVALTQKQSEFVAPIWSYLNSAVGGGRISRGREMLEAHAGVLAQAESRYGVPKEIILGIWGMETNYGSFKGDKDVIRSLATLANIRYRGDFFRDELLTALELIEKGHVERRELRGSWAGAMGHTQFMPSSYMKYAVDQTGDGHADIWTSTSDAIASTANYLKGYGWTPGLPWGIEVVVPDGFDHNLYRASFSSFRSAGVRRADGGSLPSSGEARLFYPAGHTGPAMLLTANFDVIKKYNSSDAYALAVGHLGDRIVGRPALQGEWPVKAPRLDKAGTTDVQRRLKALGLYNHDADGRIGTGTREAVRQYQLRVGMLADGYPTPALLARMKAPR